ncbi:MAG: Mrp/NBP35 family ATP-binding protein [Candidatus Promineifilaceae bacterium]|jgi:ATP-binding protein involved in chromosome partitioning
MTKNEVNSQVTEEAVIAALSTVIEPELHRDLVSLNMVRDLKIDGSDVQFTIMLTTPACPLKSKMEQDSLAALSKIDGMGQVIVNFGSDVPTDRRISNQLGQKFRNTIAVSSGKGGVGKSTLAVNLAISLANQGARVGLLDADILGPNIPTMMGVDRMPPVRDRKLVPAENYGVKFISMAFLVKPDQPLIWRGPMLHGAIQQLLTDVDWGELDYLLIDLPPGTGDAQLTLAQVLPLSGALVITQPMQVAADDALRGMKTFEKLEVPIIGVIENMSGPMFGSGAGELLANTYNVDYLGSVPMEAEVRVGGDTGDPVVVAHPESDAAAALNDIARKVAAKVSLLTLQKQAEGVIPIQMIG